MGITSVRMMGLCLLSLSQSTAGGWDDRVYSCHGYLMIEVGCDHIMKDLAATRIALNLAIPSQPPVPTTSSVMVTSSLITIIIISSEAACAFNVLLVTSITC